MSQAGVIGGGEGPGGTDLHVAKFIVGTIGQGSNYSTIASAIAAAPAGSSIFIMPGDYTEDLTISKNLNFFSSSDYLMGGTLILGSITISGAIFASFNGLRFADNGSNTIITTSSSQQIVAFNSCEFIQFTANPMLLNGNTSAISNLVFNNSFFEIETGAQLFVSTSPGSLFLNNCATASISTSITASTTTTGTVFVNYCNLNTPIISSGTAAISANYSTFSSFTGGVIPLTIGGSGTSEILYCVLDGISVSGISVASYAFISECIVNTSAVNAIAGSGTINLGEIDYIGSSSTIAGTLTIVPQNSSIGLINGGGTTGQVLTSNGPTALPTYQNAGGGGSGNLVLIQSQTVSGAASINFTTGIGSTYNDYLLKIDGVSSSMDADVLNLLVSQDGGATYLVTGYSNAYWNFTQAATGAAPSSTSFFLAFGVDIGTLAFGQFTLYSLFNGNNPNIFGGSPFSSGAAGIFSVSGGFTTNTVVNALQVIFTSGTITGTVKLYGIVN